MQTQTPPPPDDTELCARCGATTQRFADVCASCGADPRLDGRYRLLRRLGHGAVGTTFAAERVSDGLHVAIKELLVRRLEDFKAHDQFKREAGALRLLDHPAIPRYIDDFAAGEGRHSGLYLVTELIDGDTLERELETKRHSQKEVLGIIRELCDVLGYLHGLAPPVVHRDIKASNVMRRRSDQRLVLIDFGAVRESIRTAGDGSTVAGTFGYMPPEQLAGRATPASDVYALGVLCVVLLTRTTPHALLDEQNRLQWQPHITSEPLHAILADVLEPDPARRLGDVTELGRRLDDLLAGRTQARSARTAAAGGGGFGRRRQGAPDGGGERSDSALDMVAERLGLELGDVASQVPPGVAAPPPGAPRDLPRGFVGRAEPVANFMRYFGALFGGLPLVASAFAFKAMGGAAAVFLMFTAVGGGLAAIGFMRIARAKRLFCDGEAVPAIVVDSWLDTSVRLNGRSPHKIAFRYETPDGKMHEATVSRFSVPPELRVAGAQVYALYDRDKPSRATLWPV